VPDAVQLVADVVEPPAQPGYRGDDVVGGVRVAVRHDRPTRPAGVQAQQVGIAAEPGPDGEERVAVWRTGIGEQPREAGPVGGVAVGRRYAVEVADDVGPVDEVGASSGGREPVPPRGDAGRVLRRRRYADPGGHRTAVAEPGRGRGVAAVGEREGAA
jgi:hypothetical protein